MPFRGVKSLSSLLESLSLSVRLSAGRELVNRPKGENQGTYGVSVITSRSAMVGCEDRIGGGEGKSQRRGPRRLSGRNSDTFLDTFILVVKRGTGPNQFSAYLF